MALKRKTAAKGGWLPIWDLYLDDPKARRLERILNNDNADSFPMRLWLYCRRHFQAGNPPLDLIEEACRWKGEPGVLLAALIEVGFVEKDGRLHNWKTWGGAFLDAMEDERSLNAERQKRFRSRSPKEPRNALRNGKNSVTSRVTSSIVSSSCSSVLPPEEGPGETKPADPTNTAAPLPTDPPKLALVKPPDPTIGQDDLKVRAALTASTAIEHFQARYLSFHPRFSGFKLFPSAKETDAAVALLRRFGDRRFREVVDYVVADKPDPKRNWNGWDTTILSLVAMERNIVLIEAKLLAKERYGRSSDKLSNDEALRLAMGGSPRA